MSKAKLAIALSTLSVAMVAWAIPGSGVADQRVQRPENARVVTRSVSSVAPIRLRDEAGSGLLANGWINGVGPFVFAIDTGAGVSLISRNVVERAGLRVTNARRPLVGGLSTSPISSNQETQISGLALGRSNNDLPGSFSAAVVTSLPSSIDGILDPTEVFNPSGYTVDLPNRELRVFDGRLRATDVPRDGAVVRWVREAGSGRPFVRLGDGRLALIDTGSGVGLALNGGAGSNHARDGNAVRELGGGMVQSHRIAPQVVSIGPLVLNKVPTEVLTGVAPDTPILLGRGALFPFRLTFDPASRLISIEPVK